jgi:uncharacterized damage-inducible protein DinB
MNIDYIKSIYQYNDAANRRLWDSIMGLTDAQFLEDVPYSIGSVRNHMVHLAGAEARWLARLKGIPLPDYPKYEDCMTRQAAWAVWEANANALLEYVMVVKQEELEDVIVYNMPHRGGEKRSLRWQILLHLVNHATDHRAQILRILHDMGAPTFEQDYMIYLWDIQGDEQGA